MRQVGVEKTVETAKSPKNARFRFGMRHVSQVSRVR